MLTKLWPQSFVLHVSFTRFRGLHKAQALQMSGWQGAQLFWSYLGVEFRQLLFIQVSLGVDTSFIAELKQNKQKGLSTFYPFFLRVWLLNKNTSHRTNNNYFFTQYQLLRPNYVKSFWSNIGLSYERESERESRETEREILTRLITMRWHLGDQTSPCVRLSSFSQRSYLSSFPHITSCSKTRLLLFEAWV